jgi:AraC family transcriptional regulator
MTQAFPPDAFMDHADYYARGPYAQFLTDRKVVGRQPVAMFSADQPAGRYPDPPMPTVLLYLARKGVKEADFDWGAGRWTGRWRRDDLTLVPPDAASDVSLSDRHAFLGVCLPVAMFGNHTDPTGKAAIEKLGRIYASPFRDRLVTELCNTLWREVGDDSSRCSLFVDSALQLLVDRLRHLAINEDHIAEAPALSPRDLIRLEEFVRAKLQGAISVADMATVAGRSPSHFSALFRRATGRTPYRYVLALRVERACELLAASPMCGLAEIALASGFSSQSHMTAVFREIVGQTPAAFRKHCAAPER